MTLWMADDAVGEDFVGTQELIKEYDFTCRMRNDNVVMGSGKWIGESVKKHPDFAWFPRVRKAENAYVDYQVIARVMGLKRPEGRRGLGETAPER